MEGRVTKHIHRLQEWYIASRFSMSTMDAWMQDIILKLLDITHSQWIYRSLAKHHHTKGTKKLDSKEDLMKEIE